VVSVGEISLEEEEEDVEGTKSNVDSISKSCREASLKSIPYFAK